MTTRVLPPNGVATTTIANTRSYTCAADAYLDVPDHDALVLEANGWSVAAHGGVGATATRPVNPTKNMVFFDSTLGYTIKWTGKSWVSPNNGNVV